MAQLATKRLTFEEFQDLNLEGRYELVEGRLEELVSPKLPHGWTAAQLTFEIVAYLRAHEPTAFSGIEVDIPTIQFHGRRPDFLYYSTQDRTRIDVKSSQIRGVPTLVVEIVSEDDEERDTVTKRREYAQAGIAHYWIVDPRRRTVLTLALGEGQYAVAGEFSGDDHLTSELFPGLEIPLQRLFPA